MCMLKICTVCMDLVETIHSSCHESIRPSCQWSLPNSCPSGNVVERQRKESRTAPKFLSLETAWLVVSFVKGNQVGGWGVAEES